MGPPLVLLRLELIPTEFILGVLDCPFNEVASTTALRQRLQGCRLQVSITEKIGVVSILLNKNDQSLFASTGITFCQVHHTHLNT
jgi:hypothetical protein